MASFGAIERGGLDDRVRLELGGQELLVCESYEVRAGILSQPASFSVRLGHGGVAAALIKRLPPKTPFKLFVGSVQQQTGATDGYRAEGTSGATEVTLRGRDALAPLYDGYVERERSYLDSTYSELVRSALREVGLDPAKLKTSAQADRNIRAGVPITELGSSRSADEITLAPAARSPGSPSEANFTASIQSKVGERWYSFLRRYLDRAGLFLWSSVDGGYVLAQPNKDLKPAYRIVRQRGKRDNAVNVLHAEFVNETTHRHSEVVIYGRGGGRKFGRTKARGSFVDDEMVQAGYRRPLVVRDANVGTPGQAAFLAMRRLAEERRAGWSLVYRLAGHTAPSLQGGGRAVWTYDTLVEVSDDEFALDGTFYIENAEYVGGPDGTSTTIRLMRTPDCAFLGMNE